MNLGESLHFLYLLQSPDVSQFRLKTEQFKHLDRLEGLVPAYIATVVEVVRRREFSTVFLSSALA